MVFAIEQLRPFEQQCRSDTQCFLASAPDDLTGALRAFDEVFRRMYLFSCCNWGCHGKEHVFEYLAGRVVSNLASAWQLAETGYYDESLSLVRSVGEIANLLNLLWRDDQEIRTWLDSEEREHRKRYAPAAVRARLRKLRCLVPFDDDHYGRLCQLAIHPTPKTRPNAHQDSRQPVVGAVFQPIGFELTAWEMSWALASVAGPIAKLAIFPEVEARAMVGGAIELLEVAARHIPEQCG
jgi:hypothetical protein